MRSLFSGVASLGVACVSSGVHAQDLAPLPPLPSARQLAWHERETYAFIHFGVNTFTDREWGEGNESPSLFAPTSLDAKQWVRALKDGGMKMVILTAKHHDGFCLWPSAFTKHSVKSSPWREGQGDVVRELSDACREAGLEFGVYLSPWDRNSPLYGLGKPYDDYYVSQLTELLTNYGRVSEVWWDGACAEGPNGKKQIYDFARYESVVRKLAPEAVIFSDIGPDVRWVGNEAGYAGETCWAPITVDGYARGEGGPPQKLLNEGDPNGKAWLPAECDVSIRPGWFFHASENERVKSIEELLAIYGASVGRGANLLINVPPGKDGLIHPNDVKRLREIREAVDATFSLNWAFGKSKHASSFRAGHSPGEASDASSRTYWAPMDGEVAPTLEIRDLLEGVRVPGRDAGEQDFWIDHVVLGEPIELGQRVASFTLEVQQLGGATHAWAEVAKGTTIGRKRIVRFSPVRATAVRLVLTKSRATPAIASFEVFQAAPTVNVVAGERSFLGSTDVRLEASPRGAQIRFTLDGTAPNATSTLHEGVLHIDHSASLRAIAIAGGRSSITPLAAEFRAYTEADLRTAIQLFRAPDPMLRWRSFERGWQTLDQMSEVGKSTREGTCMAFDLAVRTRDEHVALVFDGFIKVPTDGIYSFSTASDDGSRLYLHDAVVVENDGLHGMNVKRGEIGLREGFHPFRVEWFNATGGRGLDVRWKAPGGADEPIPASSFFH